MSVTSQPGKSRQLFKFSFNLSSMRLLFRSGLFAMFVYLCHSFQKWGLSVRVSSTMRLQAGGKSSITSGSAKEQAAHFSSIQAAASDLTLPVAPISESNSSKRKSVPAGKEFVVVSNLKTENEVAFIVYGEPTPLQRHRVLRSGITYNPSSNLQKGFLDACRNMLPDVPFEGPLEVKMYFYFKRPLNHYGSGKRSHILKDGMEIWHSKKKDVDNLAKFVLDAINKVAYEDDGQVALLTTAKLYTEAEARVEVSIRKLCDEDAELCN